MKKIIDDAIKRFGEEWVHKRIELAGHRSSANKNGNTLTDRFIFALYEAIGAKCYIKCKICNIKITKEQIIDLLSKHQTEVLNANIDPPFFIPLIEGRFDFINKWEKIKNTPQPLIDYYKDLQIVPIMESIAYKARDKVHNEPKSGMSYIRRNNKDSSTQEADSALKESEKPTKPIKKSNKLLYFAILGLYLLLLIIIFGGI